MYISQKKQTQIQNLQQSVELLEKEKFDLQMKLTVLDQERKEWMLREQYLENDVKSLQRQLDLAQRALCLKS